MSSTNENFFKGKFAVVTGASRGIGRAITLALVSKGCQVLAISRKQESIDELKSLAADPELITPLLLDICDWGRTEELLGAAIANKRVHFLVNNATVPVPEMFGLITASGCDRMFDQIIKATINITQIVSQRMRGESAGGAIVNIGSIASEMGTNKGCLVYGTLKAGLDHLTQCLAVELAPDQIRVNSVNPGLTDTAAWQSIPPIFKKPLLDEWTSRSLFNRLIAPSEVADAVLFLLSDASSSITGINLRVDSGRLLT